MAGPSSVDEYLAQVPEEARVALEKLRKMIRTAAPKSAIETISYQMPTFKYQGRAIIGIAGFKSHCSIFPYSRTVMVTLEEELKPYDTTAKGATIRFPFNKVPPATLIKKLIKTRIDEINQSAS